MCLVSKEEINDALASVGLITLVIKGLCVNPALYSNVPEDNYPPDSYQSNHLLGLSLGLRKYVINLVYLVTKWDFTRKELFSPSKALIRSPHGYRVISTFSSL